MTQIQLHPLCEIFPRLDGAEFDELRDDIRVHGLREPIVLHDGKILDGGNRYRACLAAGIEPRFTNFANGNIVEFVLSANLHRRHLDATQRAMAVARAQDWEKAQAHGRSVQSAPGSTSKTTTKQRAEISGASVSTQRRADAVAKANPKLAEKVSRGEVALADAVRKVAPKLASRKKTSRPEKILPQRASTPTIDPLDKAREFAKQQNATIKKLRTDIAERDARIEALTAELQESRDNARDLAESLEAHMKSGEGDAVVAKEIKKLNGQIRVLESQRDQYMTKCNEAIKQINSLKRAAGKKK